MKRCHFRCRKETAFLNVLVFIVFFGNFSSVNAAPRVVEDVYSSIRIFPDNYDVEPGNREQCVRSRAGLNSLTCSANDVSLAEITLPQGAPSTCKAGETVSQKLNFKVTSTANIRYNFSFYTTTNPLANPLDGVPGGNSNECLIWVGEVGDAGGLTNSQSANGDLCADVTKSQDAVYQEEVITFFCQDTDGDSFVDLDYCATWDQNDDNLCSSGGEIQSGLLPTPGAPSKCNCETVTIPVKVLPSEPLLEKIINGDATRPESDIFAGNDSFSFNLKVTNPNSNTSLVITELVEKFGGEEFLISGSLSSSTVSLNEDQVVLVNAVDNDGRCLASGSETIAPGATYICTVTLRWKSLILVDTDSSIEGVREDKVSQFGVHWKFDDSPEAYMGPSNSLTVSISDVPPIISIAKVASPTSIPETGPTGFDYVHYYVTYSNESGWDQIHVKDTDFIDLVQEMNTTSEPKPVGYTGCAINGLTYTQGSGCDYGVNMGTLYSSINAGDVYKNTVKVIPTDEEGTSGELKTAAASISVENVNPVVTLKKYVRAGLAPEVNPLDPAGYHDMSTSVDEYQLTDLSRAPVVTFLFVVSNSSFENFEIMDFVDFAQAETFGLNPPAQVFDSNIADTVPVDDTCSGLIGSSVAVNESVACTMSFKVAGDDSDSVDNIAWVLVSDGEQEAGGSTGQGFDTDDAMVEFNPVGNSIALGLDMSATVKLSVTAHADNVEVLSFEPLSDVIVMVATEDPNAAETTLDEPLFSGSFDQFTVANIDCSSTTIDPGYTYSCSFTFTPKGEYTATAGLQVLNDTLKVRVRDDDGTVQELSAVITVEAQ